MNARELRSAKAEPEVSMAEMGEWRAFRLGNPYEWEPAARARLREMIRRSNEAMRGLLLEAHQAARRHGIEQVRGG